MLNIIVVVCLMLTSPARVSTPPIYNSCDVCLNTYCWNQYNISRQYSQYLLGPTCIDPPEWTAAYDEYVEKWFTCQMNAAYDKYLACCQEHNCTPEPYATYHTPWGLGPAKWQPDIGEPIWNHDHTPCDRCYDQYQTQLRYIYQRWHAQREQCQGDPACEQNVDQWLSDTVDQLFVELVGCTTAQCDDGWPADKPGPYWNPTAFAGHPEAGPPGDSWPDGCNLLPPEGVTWGICSW